LTPLLGILILIGLTFQFKSPTMEYQRELTAAAFVLICAAGATLSVYPRWLSIILKKGKSRNEVGEGYLGHHPTCGSFSTHILRSYAGTFCAGCFGLALGALAAIIFTLSSLVFEIPIKPEYIFPIGLTLTVIGILQHALDFDKPLLHSILNVSLVLGVGLIRVGAGQLNGGIVVEVYALAIALYIILARIELSQHDHKMICDACGKKPCMFSYAEARIS
jgi:hypothetical protein